MDLSPHWSRYRRFLYLWISNRSSNLRLNFSETKTFSECPKYYWESRKLLKKPIDRMRAITISAIKKAYLRSIETGYRANWRQIMGWIDVKVFKDIDINDQQVFQASRKLAEYCLIAAKKWYEDFYLKEDYYTYIDMTLGIEKGSHYFYESLDGIQLSKPVKVMVFSRDEITTETMYNDFLMRGKALIVAHNLGYQPIALRVWTIGDYGAFSTYERVIPQCAHKRTLKGAIEVADAIQKRVSYPSRTSACHECPIFRRCRL